MPLSIREFIVLFLAIVGTLFMLVTALGLFRFPDLYTRMHALGKASTVGISGLLLSTGVFYYEESGLFLRMILLLVLFFITTPIAATTVGRAAYRRPPEDAPHLFVDEMAADQRPQEGERAQK